MTTESSTKAEHVISQRFSNAWDAYKKRDAAGLSALLAAEYTAVNPDGTLHLGKPTLQDIAAAPIVGYSLSEVRVEMLEPEIALVTGVAEVETPGGARARLVVGEIWVKQSGQWLCRYYQGTPTK